MQQSSQLVALVIGAARGSGVARQRALIVQTDLTNADALVAMAAQVDQAFGQIDTLALNASDGLEKDRDGDYALRLNRDAQRAMLEVLMPLLRPGGVVSCGGRLSVMREAMYDRLRFAWPARGTLSTYRSANRVNRRLRLDRGLGKAGAL